MSANAPKSCSAPSSRLSEVIETPSIPHGTTHSNGCRSLLTLTASPCVVTPRLTWSPIEPILRVPTQTPVRPSIVLARTPASPSASIIVRSSPRT